MLGVINFVSKISILEVCRRELGMCIETEDLF